MTSIPHYHSTFPGEAYLNLSLPNYAWERKAIIIKVFASAFLFLVYLPRKYAFQTVTLETRGQEQAAAETKFSSSSSNGNGALKKKKKRRNKNDKPSPPTSSQEEQQETVIEIDTLKSSLFTLLFLLSIFTTLLLSPNNLFPSRTVLRAPLLTPQECAKLVELAEGAAKRNAVDAKVEKKELMKRYPLLSAVEKEVDGGKRNETEVIDNVEGWRELRRLKSVLSAPAGWKKDRHTLYPTTDLNLVTDPFEPQDREWLASILDARLSPLMERAYGVHRGSIRANDIFVVRYDGGGKEKGLGQDRLRAHTDSSHLSFNVLLNTEFEGGGTRFHSRILKEKAIDIHPELGETLLSHAMVLHEGLPTTSGTRYILVGFNSIDEKDPLTNESTNLSIFSSWLNFSWMQVRFREGAERGRTNRRKSRRDGNEGAAGIFSNKYIISLFRDLDSSLTWLGDKYAPLKSGKLIPDDKAEEYIQTMDQAMVERVEYEKTRGIERTRANGYSSWFQGQNIHLDVFGGYADSWFVRKTSEDKFKSENL